MISYVKGEITTVLYLDQKMTFILCIIIILSSEIYSQGSIFLSLPRYSFISVHTWICNHKFAKACTNSLVSTGSTHFAGSAHYLMCPMKISHKTCARGLAHFKCCCVPEDPEGDASCVLHRYLAPLTLPALTLGSSNQFLQ